MKNGCSRGYVSRGAHLALFVLISILAGCGGGGGGGGGTVTPTQYTVTATATTGGSVSPATQQVDAGAVAQVSVAAEAGYLVSSVTGCGGSFADPIYTTAAVNADCTVAAVFEEDPAVQSQVSITGQVIGSGGVELLGKMRVLSGGGLSGVTVTAGGQSATTDANGMYSLSGITLPEDNRLVITFSKAGYANYQRSIEVEAGETFAVTARMTAYTVADTYSTAADIVVEDSQNRVRIDLPQGALPGDLDEVMVSMAVGDPTTDDGRQAFPGDYMATESGSDDPVTPLESIAFTEITIDESISVLRRAKGEVPRRIKTLNEGTYATVTMKLPAIYQVGGELHGLYDPNDPDKNSIEWWSYDEERAVWVQEDADPDNPGVDNALITLGDDGFLYGLAKVNHFSWWNIDRPISEQACVCVTVEDNQGTPRRGIEVMAEGISQNTRTAPRLTNDQGEACVTVERSKSDSSPVKIRMLARLGNVEIPWLDGQSSDVINVWTTPGSTIGGASGTCQDLSGSIVLDYSGSISGSVVYEGSETPVAGVNVYTSFGETMKTAADGLFSFSAPLNAPVLVYVPGLQSQTVTLTESEKTATLTFEISNRAPVISGMTRNPASGLVDPGGSVTLTASASDPDGDPISYEWSATTGSIAPMSGGDQASHSVVWVAPDGAGTATITVTVRDNKGRSVQETLSLSWGGGTTTDSLKITFKDTPSSNTPVAGVVVALHSTNQRSVEQTIVTGADGVADFGTIGRSTSMITMGYELAFSHMDTVYWDRYIDTLVDYPSGEWVIYLDSPDTSDYYQTYYCDGEAYDFTVTPDLQGYEPTADETVVVGPLMSWYGGWKPGDAPLALQVCDNQLQTDARISLLAKLLQFADQNYDRSVFDRYGYVVDIDPAALTETVPVALDRRAVSVGWSSNLPITGLDLLGYRKGIIYPVSSGMSTGWGGTGLESGVVPLARDFTVDFYDLVVRSEEQLTGATLDRTAYKRYLSVPDEIQATLKDTEFSNPVFDAAQKSVSWTRTGTVPTVYSVEFSGESLDLDEEGWTRWFDWTVSFAGDQATQVVLPDLPQELSQWVDFQTLRAGSIDGLWLSSYSTYQELLLAMLGGQLYVDNGVLNLDGVSSVSLYIEEQWEEEPAAARTVRPGRKTTRDLRKAPSADDEGTPSGFEIPRMIKRLSRR